MKRRTAIKSMVGGAGALFANQVFGAPGWVINPYVVENFGARSPRNPKPDRKRFHTTFAPFKGASQETNKNVLLYDSLKKEIGSIIPHEQSGVYDANGRQIAEGEGDCVAQAIGMGGDILAATNIHELGKREKWVEKTSVEMTYAGSRNEIGLSRLAGRAGSHGEWGAKFVHRFGFLHRKKYRQGENTIDLSGYDPRRSRKYRDAGVPDWLESIAREHPVKEITNVHTGAEALDAVCARQVVVMCSSYAFHHQRDEEGFSTPHLGMGWVRYEDERGRRRRTWGRVMQWWHAMLLSGAILEGHRKGGVIQNSHGVWNAGPQPHGIPDGGFAVDLNILDLMVKDWFDCYALSLYTGHAARRMKHQLYRR